MDAFKMTKFFVFAFFIFFSFLRCTSESPVLESLDKNQVIPDPEPKNLSVAESSKEYLQKLNRIAPSGSPRGELIKDIRLLLLAESYSENKEYEKSAQYYFKALEIASGTFGEIALKKWVATYAKSLDQKVKISFFARLLNDVSKSGDSSPFLQKLELTNAESFYPIIREVARDYVTDDVYEQIPFPSAPEKEGRPIDDPTLVKTSESYCLSDATPSYQWSAWKNSLSELEKSYWENLILLCKGQEKLAVSNFIQLLPKLKANPLTLNLTIVTIKKLAIYYRFNDSRETAADYYSLLSQNWQNTEISAEAMGMDDSDFQLERINDLLWAGRYRSLIGDYENAKIFTNKALDYIKIAYTIKEIQSKKMKQDLANLKAEAYIILSNRIAIEKRDINSAIALMLVAQNISNMSREMKDHINWYTGFFYYLDSKWTKAIRYFEILKNTTNDEDDKARAYFWIARSYIQLTQKDKATENIANLALEYPHNFYTIVASSESGITTDEIWKNTIGDKKDLVDRLTNRSKFDLSSINNNNYLLNKLQRAEILAVSKVGIWSQEAVNDLDQALYNKLNMRDDASAFIYLSRLHFVVENYDRAIVLTSRLRYKVRDFWNKWPEQILIYFPLPYYDVYARNAMETSLDKKLLLSISRQESAFNPNAKSNAGAYGLMQLIIPTAKRMSQEVGIRLSEPTNQLIEPEINIKLGSQYLKDLSIKYSSFPPAVYGAYNAGEFAVDSWMEKRGHKDPLAWIELVPFGETRGYIKNVWRNYRIYEYLESRNYSHIINRLEKSISDSWLENTNETIHAH